MRPYVTRSFAALLFTCMIGSGEFAQPQCGVDVAIVRGRIESAPANASVRVQLVYQEEKTGESAEIALEKDSFRIQVPFLTWHQKRGLHLHNKCERKPQNLIVTLFRGEKEYDRISLDFAQDFTQADRSGFMTKTEIVLHGLP